MSLPKSTPKLSDAVVKTLAVPAKGYRITWDKSDDGTAGVAGFGCQVTAAGKRTFIFNYRNKNGRDRRLVIAECSDWKTSLAREKARELRQAVKDGEDPQAEKQADRDAKTIGDLCDRFVEDFLPDTIEDNSSSPKPTAVRKGRLRYNTQRMYADLIKNYIWPALKNTAVAALTFEDVDRLHNKITKKGAGYTANRMLSVLSRMINIAIKWQWRTDNPVRGVERNHESKRQRYLSPAELLRLSDALKSLLDQQAANIIRLLLLTGARRGETFQAKWKDFDLTAGVWIKPGATTKTKTDHRVPLSAPARQLLAEMREKAPADAEYVFPGRGSPHRVDIKFEWYKVCKRAELVTADGKPSARIHDLRHTYASVLASSGSSLPVIGALLGHTQPSTTQRYAHLMDDPLRQATERVGAIVMGQKDSDNVVPLDRIGRGKSS